MGILDALFGGSILDTNGDGHIDAGEEFMAYLLFEEMQREEDQRRCGFYDDYDL